MVGDPEHATGDGARNDAAEPAVEQPMSGAGVISPQFVAQIIGAVGDGDRHYLRRTLHDLHPADAADLLEAMPRDVLRRITHLLDAHLPAEVLAELDNGVRHDVLEELSDAGVAALLEDLDSDDASFILNDLEDDRRARILSRVSAPDRAALESTLSFDEETAGRLMQRDFVAAPVFWTVGQAIDHMRSVADLPDIFFEIYLVDPGFRLMGTVPVSTLLRSPREVSLESIKREPLGVARPEMDQEEVAYLFQQYNLASAPVVDDAGRLTGMITVDDMVDVIQEENTEDLLALSGVSEAGANQTILAAVKARAPWLALNLVTAFCAASVVSLFQSVINEVVALAILMPVVAGLGGNVGSQALAVAVRAIAERDLEGPAVARAIRREAATAVINGLLIASLAALVVLVWFRQPALAGVVLVAMFTTFSWAGMAGILAPLAIKRLGADPAVASSVFVLTSIDMAGFFVFLGLAKLTLV